MKIYVTRHGLTSDVKKRLLTFFNHLNKKHKDFETLIITHGGMIRLIHLFEHGEPVYETKKHVSLIEVDLDKIIKNAQNYL